MEPAGNDSSKGFLKDVNDFFCSVKLSIVVLIALALTSIFGTVVEQGKDPAAYVQAYGDVVGGIIRVVNLGDMYHSWWFLLLLAVLLVNITFCSIRRLPQALRLMKERDPVFDGRPVAIHERWERSAGGASVEETAAKVEGLLAGALGRPTRKEVDGKVYLFATRGAWSRLGVYVTHFSLFLFAVGAQVGVWTGMKGFVEIPEGETVNQVALREGGAQNLGFEVRCDKFEVTYYPDPQTGRPSGRPKDYKSWLTVFENGRQVLQKTIEVNDPLIYKGIYFYQSSFGQRGAKAAFLSVFGARRNRVAANAKIVKGGTLDLEGGAKLRMLDMTADYRGMGPAVLVAVEDAGKVTNPMVVQGPDGPVVPVGDYLVHLDGMDATMYTGLQVAKDPGVPIIWAGCIFITLGLLTAFFASHKRVWVRVKEGAKGTEVLVAGNASRNRLSFEKWFESFTQQADEALGK